MYVVRQDKLWWQEKGEIVEKQRITKYMDSMIYISGCWVGVLYSIVKQ